jgi:ribonuclease Y
MSIITIALLISGGAVATVMSLFVIRKIKINSAVQRAEKTMTKAKQDASRIIQDAEREAHKTASQYRREAEAEAKARQQSITEIENRLMQKDKQLEDKLQSAQDKKVNLEQEMTKIKQLKVKQDEIIGQLSERLEKISGLSKEEAETQLLANIERESRNKASALIKKLEDEAKKIAAHKAKEIVTDAIQRTAVDHVRTATTSIVQLPDDDMKGRVIGREGRNIRAFESVTGVDIIIDDAPGAVIISAFDPIRREIARIALTSLIKDGRIHPARVEESVESAKKELNEIIVQRGEEVADKLGQQFHPKIIELIGRLYYRHSYGQNIWHHSLEAAHIAGIMAAELGVNVNLAKRGAMLHDIGKALDFEQEGSHTVLGRDVCEKYGESAEILNCIMAHHEEEPPDTIEAVLVMMADAISSVRPGARSESIERYVKRLENLEAIANSYDGVEKSFAIQAGREVRVIVRPDDVDDKSANKIAFDIAKQIENEVDYPGEVKVSVIRETRAYSIAK